MSSATRMFLDRVRECGDTPALTELASAGGSGRSWTWREWQDDAFAFAAAVLAEGLAPGERVAILSANRALWPISDLGSLLAGQVPLGLYPTSAPLQVRRILDDSGARLLVVDGEEQLRKALDATAGMASRPLILAQDVLASADDGVVSFDAWLDRGREVLGRSGTGGIERRVAAAGRDDLALLIYTSGSTGEPKGARIPHEYLLASASSIRETLGLRPDDSSLSLLPYNHAGERVFGLYTRIAVGMAAGLAPDPRRVWEAAAEFRPTLFGGLPRFYEKVYESLRAERPATGLEADRWDRVLELGRSRSRSLREGRPFADRLEAEWLERGAPLFERARAFFGGRVRIATSGGAPLDAEVAEFLDALGITVLGAYGLTEHLCAAFNRPTRYRFDSVGTAMPGSEIRIAGDGEILLRRGPLTFAGYHGRPSETTEAFGDDSVWLRTGDLGSLDDSGTLRVTGRKKELIVLSTGKKLAPLPIESQLAEDELIAQAVLYGDGHKFVTALLCLSAPALREWARAQGIERPDSALADSSELRARLQSAVDGVNAQLAPNERIQRFVVLGRELSVEEDELTPTFKVRRPVVAQRHGDRLEHLYA